MPLDRRVRVIVSCVISFKAQLWGKGGRWSAVSHQPVTPKPPLLPNLRRITCAGSTIGPWPALLSLTSSKVCLKSQPQTHTQTHNSNFRVEFRNHHSTCARESLAWVARYQAPQMRPLVIPEAGVSPSNLRRSLDVKPKSKIKLQQPRISSESRTFCIKIQDMASIARPSLFFFFFFSSNR